MEVGGRAECISQGSAAVLRVTIRSQGQWPATEQFNLSGQHRPAGEPYRSDGRVRDAVRARRAALMLHHGAARRAEPDYGATKRLGSARSSAAGARPRFRIRMW